MAGSFFDFDTDLPSLGSANRESEILTSDVEEEGYDALNDQTFGADIPVGDDWENSLGLEADNRTRQDGYGHNDSLADRDDYFISRDEELEQSISQLVLDDDEDDYFQNGARPTKPSTQHRYVFNKSPPPPAIIELDHVGSPKTSTIWSAPVQADKRVDSLLRALKQTHGYTKPSLPQEDPSIISLSEESLPPSLSQRINIGSQGITLSPQPAVINTSTLPHFIPNAKTLEEIEREILNSSPATRKSPLLAGARNLEDVERDILLRPRARTLSEVEREINNDQSPRASPQPILPHQHSTPKQSPNVNPAAMHLNQANGPLNTMAPMIHPAARVNSPFELGMVPPPAPSFPLGSPAAPNYPLPSPMALHNRMIPPQLIALQRSPLVLNALAGQQELINKQIQYMQSVGMIPRPNFVGVPEHFQRFSRPPVRHPLLNQNQQPRPWQNRGPQPRNFQNISMEQLNALNRSPGARRASDGMDGFRRASDGGGMDGFRRHSNDDNYDNLMTEKEKEWLIKIQMLQLQCDKPYVDDYYFAHYTSKKQQKRENGDLSNVDHHVKPPPGRTRSDSRGYVPVQYEGSLGKLQAASVHFPRKIIDLAAVVNLEDVDADGKSANKDVRRFRQMLLDIEKLYTTVLEIDDYNSQLSQEEDWDNRLTEARDAATIRVQGALTAYGHEKIGPFLTVRKGKSLMLRVLPLINKEIRRMLILGMIQYLPSIIRRDHHDQMLGDFLPPALKVIEEEDFSVIVELGQALQYPGGNNPLPGRSPLNIVLQSKVGVTIVFALLVKSEHLYQEKEKSLDTELHSAWSKVIVHFVDVLCTISDNQLCRGCSVGAELTAHFQRFPIERTKFSILEGKLKTMTSLEEVDSDST